MSASFASITGVTDSPPPKAEHGEFPFSTSMLSARTRREIGPSMIVGDNDGVHAELRREKGRLQLLLDLAGEAVSNQELRDLVRAMMMSIRSAIDSDRVCIFLERPNGGELEVYALDFTSEAGSFKEGTTVPLAGTITSHVFQTGKPWTGTREQACAVFSRQLLFAESFGTGCMLPLLGRNRVLWETKGEWEGGRGGGAAGDQSHDAAGSDEEAEHRSQTLLLSAQCAWLQQRRERGHSRPERSVYCRNRSVRMPCSMP